MANETKTASKTAPTAPAKPRAPQKRVLHIFYKAGTPGADGTPTLEIVNVLSDARKVVDFMDTDVYTGGGVKRYKYEIISEPRDSGEAEAAPATTGTAM